MPVELTKLAAKRVQLSIPIDDETLTVQYRPRALTPATQEEVDQLPARELYKLVILLVESWDLVTSGKPVKLTEAALKEVPSELLELVVVKIIEHLRPNLPTPAENSGSFS